MEIDKINLHEFWIYFGVMQDNLFALDFNQSNKT